MKIEETKDNGPLYVIAEELRPILRRVRLAKEILGDGGLNAASHADKAYHANKELETVQFRLSDLIEELEKGKPQ